MFGAMLAQAEGQLFESSANSFRLMISCSPFSDHPTHLIPPDLDNPVQHAHVPSKRAPEHFPLKINRQWLGRTCSRERRARPVNFWVPNIPFKKLAQPSARKCSLCSCALGGFFFSYQISDIANQISDIANAKRELEGQRAASCTRNPLARSILGVEIFLSFRAPH